MNNLYKRICIFLAFLIVRGAAQPAPKFSVITDNRSYNIALPVSVRIEPFSAGTIAIRFAGENSPVVSGIPIRQSGYHEVWKIPSGAQTGRYDIDFTPAGGIIERSAASFAVYRKLLQIVSAELDKPFYTKGDPIGATVIIRNLSPQTIKHVSVNLEPYNYPWVAPAPDEPRIWQHAFVEDLSLPPHEQKILRAGGIAKAEVDDEPIGDYFAVVASDGNDPGRIYDLAFPLPAFVRPPNVICPKQYPFLYLYWHLRDVPASQAYRHFYPPRYVSEEIHFNTAHTMFRTHAPLQITFTVSPAAQDTEQESLNIAFFDSGGRELQRRRVPSPIAGTHQVEFPPQPPGLYFARVELSGPTGTVVDRNQLELAVNDLPASILVFCAHEDDDTAHPGLIRAAAENHIPIHFVYFTSGEAGGCDRFFMHSCDPVRALDFGEVRMAEARASLKHLGTSPNDIFFLGLPDGGLGHIWYNHQDDRHPYLSVLLATEHAPYSEAAIANLPYSLDAAISAAKHFIEMFHPELIVTGHPDERHVDHRTVNWIVVKAMQELLHQGHLSESTQLLVDVSYGAMPGKHAPYHYEKIHFFVSGEAAKLGQEAAWYYQSQDGNHQQARIIDFDHLPREEPYPHYRILDWFDHEGWNE
jgi:LmbE family N-acetylglucosaminyl deacetylase